MKKALRRIKRLGIILVCILGVSVATILIIDWFLSQCTEDEDIVVQISEVDSALLRQHVTELSAIGSRFVKVKPASGIKESLRGTNSKFYQINGKLRPYGLRLVDGDHRERKLNYIQTQLESYGYNATTYTTQFRHFPYQSINLVAQKLGQSSPEQVLDVTAHYDTYGSSPGADDNNSGVAGVLEMARLISKGKAPNRTIRFVFFDLEELGLIGSRAWVSSSIDKSNGIVPSTANLNLEMIGFYTNEKDSQQTPVRIPFIVDPPRQGDFLTIVGNLDSYQMSQKLEGVFRTYTPEFSVFNLGKYGDLLADATRSDHYSYWEQGIPAVVVSDTANFRNPHYHQSTDTPDKLDYEKMAEAVKALTAFAIEW